MKFKMIKEITKLKEKVMKISNLTNSIKMTWPAQRSHLTSYLTMSAVIDYF